MDGTTACIYPNDGPIGPDANMSFWVGGAAMAAPLATLTVALALTGAEYLSSVRSAGRAGALWASAVTAAVTAEVVFICAFVAPGRLLGMAPGRVNWGLLALSASFAVTGHDGHDHHGRGEQRQASVSSTVSVATSGLAPNDYRYPRVALPTPP